MRFSRVFLYNGFEHGKLLPEKALFPARTLKENDFYPPFSLRFIRSGRPDADFNASGGNASTLPKKKEFAMGTRQGCRKTSENFFAFPLRPRRPHARPSARAYCLCYLSVLYSFRAA